MQHLKVLRLDFDGVVFSKKNSKRIIQNRCTGRPMLISSKQALANEAEMVRQFMVQAMEAGWALRTPEECAGRSYKIQILITERDKRRRDLDNQATAILDALVSAGVIPDDSNRFVKWLEVGLMGYDKDVPGAAITIKETTSSRDGKVQV